MKIEDVAIDRSAHFARMRRWRKFRHFWRMYFPCVFKWKIERAVKKHKSKEDKK